MQLYLIWHSHAKQTLIEYLNHEPHLLNSVRRHAIDLIPIALSSFRAHVVVFSLFFFCLIIFSQLNPNQLLVQIISLPGRKCWTVCLSAVTTVCNHLNSDLIFIIESAMLLPNVLLRVVACLPRGGPRPLECRGRRGRWWWVWTSSSDSLPCHCPFCPVAGSIQWLSICQDKLPNDLIINKY